MDKIRFNALIHRIDPEVKGYGKVELVFNNLLMCYSQSHRFYHDTTHIDDGLKVIDEIKDLIKDINSFELAWYFHDSVYIPNFKFNEMASAEYLNYQRKILGLVPSVHQKAEVLISMTNVFASYFGDMLPNDTKLFLDVDYSIFAKDAKEYDVRIQGIYKEYFYEKAERRIDFLKSLLARRKTIFHHEYFIDKYEKKAQKNIKREIKELQLKGEKEAVIKAV
jgi:predicted metal-dependent HD superfamily phosphohydrolase